MIPKPEPIEIRFSQEYLQAKAKEYVTWLYGKPNMGDSEKWMERYGLLMGFVDELFSKENLWSGE